MATSSIIRLTDATNNQTQLRLFTAPVDATQGLSVTFDFFSYGGSNSSSGSTLGGDGIGFFLINGAESKITPGSFGGSLGYAQRTGAAPVSGIPGGYLGVGFDEFGNFSSPTEGRVGGIGRTPNSVAVRGSQATSYRYLTGTQTLPVNLAVPGARGNRENSRRRAKVDLSPTGQLTVQVDLNNNNVFESTERLIDFNVITQGQNGALPSTLRFGFGGSTGAATNIHEVGNFTVTTFAGAPVVGNFDDQIITGGGTQTGGRGADTFVFAGASKAAALRSSRVSNPRRVTDFSFAEGDRFQLDFDNNLNTPNRPKSLSNAGTIRAQNLTEAVKAAYADKNFRKRGSQSLRGDEAVFFRFGKRTYLSIDDNKAPFSSRNDLVTDVTGIQFKTGDIKKGSLAVGNYFA